MWGVASVGDMQAFLVVAGVWLAGHGLRTFEVPLLRRAGAVLYLAATYLAGFHAGAGSPWMGGLALGMWFLLPWVEILLRVRPLRLPAKQVLGCCAAPAASDFPELAALTGEAEGEGFERGDDVGWEAGGMRQFVRIFYRESDRLQLLVCYQEQGPVVVTHLSVTSRYGDGRQYVTSDFPFSAAMKPRPEVVVRQVVEAASVRELVDGHVAWLESAEGRSQHEAEVMVVDDLAEKMTGELQGQFRYNVETGILREDADGSVRYSWRGFFFLWTQYLRDLVRLA